MTISAADRLYDTEALLAEALYECGAYEELADEVNIRASAVAVVAALRARGVELVDAKKVQRLVPALRGIEEAVEVLHDLGVPSER